MSIEYFEDMVEECQTNKKFLADEKKKYERKIENIKERTKEMYV